MKRIFGTSSRAPLHKTFTLIPYPAANIPAIEITGAIIRQDNIISIHYSVRGEIKNILLPNPSTSSRKDDLWKATCFEFFIAIPNLPEYWEFNMSPSSEWNIYHMDTYRRIGFREESAIDELQFAFKQTANEFSADISVNLHSIIRLVQNLQVNVTAIIQTKDKNETYWSLAHPSQQADFHLKESFIINI